MSWNDTISFGTTHIPELEIAFRLLLAVLLGGISGFEREMHGHAAGLRTHMLTSLAAAMFTVLTFEIFYEIRSMDNPPNIDPIRLIEAVTAGVSFLAAGTIIHGSGKVQGLTTGAGIWMAGAVGVACGAGFYSVAVMGTVLAMTIIIVLRRVKRYWLRRKGTHE